MARIVVLQHNEHAHAGRLARALRDQGFRLDTHRVDLAPGQGGKAVPEDLDNIHALIVLGGAQNVDEGHAFLAKEQALIRNAHAAELPIVGVCLGAQQVAVALGGQVARMPTPEVGISPVTLSGPGQTETILAGIPWSCPQLHSHAYHITQAPPGAAVLGSSAATKVQAFRVGMRTYGFQYHFECDIPMTRDMFDRSASLASEAGITRAQLDAQLEQHAEMFDRAADRLCNNLVTFAFNFDELFAV